MFSNPIWYKYFPHCKVSLCRTYLGLLVLYLFHTLCIYINLHMCKYLNILSYTLKMGHCHTLDNLVENGDSAISVTVNRLLVCSVWRFAAFLFRRFVNKTDINEQTHQFNYINIKFHYIFHRWWKIVEKYRKVATIFQFRKNKPCGKFCEMRIFRLKLKCFHNNRLFCNQTHRW